MIKQSRKQMNRAASIARQRRQRLLVIGGSVALLVIVIGAVALASTSDANSLGEAVALQGAPHIEPGESHPPYNSDPPTSGWHYAFPLEAGFHEEPAPDEQVVHNLEHGHVVISYDCSKLDGCVMVKLMIREIVDQYDSWKVTAVPRENRDSAIALTAWGRIDTLDAFDGDRIRDFIDAWRDRGPEHTSE